MDRKPLVSVIVPIYNVEQYLDRCVQSLIQQDYKPLEIILVDDCSTDSSAQIAKKYSQNHPDICIFVQREKNGGLSAARNSGMRIARGDWLSFVDSDDWVSEDYISLMEKKAVDEDVDVVIGNANYAYDSGEMKTAKAFGDISLSSPKKDIIALCRSYACGRLFKASLFRDNKIDFPEDIRRSEDIGTIIPVLTKAKAIGLVDKPIYFYYQRKNSISNTNKNIDLSFYPKTLQRMVDLSKCGYEEELEFRAIHEMLYGMVYLMIDSGKSKEEFINHIEWFKNKFPKWRKNKYFDSLPHAKKIFISLASNKRYSFLKMLVIIKKTLVKL